MPSDTIKALQRLKARLGRERGRARRMHANATTTSGKERAHVENYMCGIAMGFVDDEIRRAKKESTNV